ncbi:MAG: HAD family hydrolase [Candidatus Nanopelagicales bacterium]
MSYLIATDLDGTLLRRDFSVSDRTRNALRAATDAGIEVIYATGRPPHWLPSVYETTGHRPITVCANGALTLQADEPISIDAIDPDVVDEVRELLLTSRSDFVFQTEVWRGHTLKLLGFLPDQDHELADDVLELVREAAGHLVEATHSSHGRLLIEMGPSGVTKAKAVRRIREQRWPEHTFIAIGDMPNDLALLQSADIPMTVESGHSWLREATANVLPGPESDGVAQLLEALVEGRSVSQFTGP